MLHIVCVRYRFVRLVKLLRSFCAWQDIKTVEVGLHPLYLCNKRVEKLKAITFVSLVRLYFGVLVEFRNPDVIVVKLSGRISKHGRTYPLHM